MPVRSLVSLQHRIHFEQLQQLSALTVRLNETNRELAAARDTALAATQVKSDFLANMSHEIRTPMNGVIGMTSLLLGTPLKDDEREHVETVRSSDQSLLVLINDILDFSKIESGKLEFERQPIAFDRLLLTSLNLFSASAAEKHIDLGHLLAPDTPVWIWGDATRLQQTFVNLISNALKFTERGDVFATVRVVPHNALAQRIRPDPTQPPPDVWLQTSVQNSGIGIPPERMDRLFQTFSQVDASTARRYGGTGLGLAICRRLCELMGGAIRCESVPGTGSTFHVLLPYSIHTPTVPLDSTGESTLAGKRLIIVDDNLNYRHLLRHHAESWGLRVAAVSSLSELPETPAKISAYDFVVLDGDLTDRPWETCLAPLLAVAPAPALVALDTPGNHAHRSHLQACGVRHFLNRPVSAFALKNLLLHSSGPRLPTRTERRADVPATALNLRLLVAEDNPSTSP
ncbi:MAG: hypothetical protein H7343_23745 [Undibacterium sp.]|nr:hypothetical protein [Opitutaceae bacterium]